MSRVFNCERYDLTDATTPIGETDLGADASRMINRARKAAKLPAAIVEYFEKPDAFFISEGK